MPSNQASATTSKRMPGLQLAWGLGHHAAVSVLGVVATTALAGCAARVVKPSAPVAKPETSYKLVAPPGAPQYALKPGQSASLPTPLIGHFAPPIYPATLAHPGMPPVTVTAQLAFGTDGKVYSVRIVSNSYAGVDHALFGDAVRTAAKDWAFTPLVFEAYVDHAGATPALQRTPKPFSLWFEFRFAMVDGKPAVAATRH